jgi:hypothetical protein
VSTPAHGALRILIARIRKQKLTSTDAKVGHVNILRFSELLPKFKRRGWRISLAFTKNIFPPLLDEIHFPKATAPLIDLLEFVMNNLAPAIGNITFIKLESDYIPNT